MNELNGQDNSFKRLWEHMENCGPYVEPTDPTLEQLENMSDLEIVFRMLEISDRLQKLKDRYKILNIENIRRDNVKYLLKQQSNKNICRVCGKPAWSSTQYCPEHDLAFKNNANRD